MIQLKECNTNATHSQCGITDEVQQHTTPYIKFNN